MIPLHRRLSHASQAPNTLAFHKSMRVLYGFRVPLGIAGGDGKCSDMYLNKQASTTMNRRGRFDESAGV